MKKNTFSVLLLNGKLAEQKIVSHYKDNRVRDKFGMLDDIYKIELGRRHCDIIARFGADELNLSQQGFYTSWGRFLNREDALSLALENGQVIDHVHETKLFSEDLY